MPTGSHWSLSLSVQLVYCMQTTIIVYWQSPLMVSHSDLSTNPITHLLNLFHSLSLMYSFVHIHLHLPLSFPSIYSLAHSHIRLLIYWLSLLSHILIQSHNRLVSALLHVLPLITNSIIRHSDWLRVGRPRSRSSSPGRVKNFLFSTSYRPVLGSTQPSIQWVPGALSLGCKAAGAWSWPLTSN
jgi:hypothetical protein